VEEELIVSECYNITINKVGEAFLHKINALIPELSVSDMEQSLYFYSEILLFKIEYQRPEDKFAFLSLNDCQIMMKK
jgi:hypothetical protein